MSVLSKLSSTFLPTDKAARARRKDVFGTENKAVAGGLIIAGAGAAIYAGAAIAAGTATRSIAKAVAGTSTATKLVTLGVAPLAVGTVINDPKIVTRTAGGVVNFEKNLFLLGKDPSLDNAKNLIVENPFISAAAAGSLLLATGGIGATISAANTAANTAAIKENTDTVVPTGDAVGTNTYVTNNYATPPQNITSSPSSMAPVTQETQPLSSVRTGASMVKRKRRSTVVQPIRNSVRVVILNRNR